MQRDEAYKAQKVLEMVEQGSLPATLYCYKPVNEYTLDIFNSGTFWFSSPIGFNDPFDCKVYPSKESARRRTKDQLEKKGILLTDEEAKEIVTDEAVKKAVDKVMNGKGILCLTPHPDNILMWSHYADNHKGICLELDVRACPEFFVYPVKVAYETEYPTFNLGEETDKIYATKYEKWAYEDEIRIMKDCVGKHEFASRCLRSVIFGCSADKRTKQVVRMVIERNPHLRHVTYKNAIQDERCFKLHIV
jgi:hypothetical protein